MMLTGIPNTPTVFVQALGLPQPSVFSKRRANSCKPCRDSKSRCSGGMPCTTCQKKRDKPECFYLTSFPRNQPRQVHDSEHSHGEAFGSCRGAKQGSDKLGAVEGARGLATPQQNFCGTLSLSRSIDEFKSLLPTNGRFREILDSIRPVQVFKLEGHAIDLEPATDRALTSRPEDDPDVELPPRLLPLYKKYRSVRDLLSAGKATQAWAAFPGLVRDAEILGLDIDMSLATPEADKDSQPGRYLCWLLVDLDVQLSFLLGRCPFIAPFHGIPRPIPTASRQEEQDLQENVYDFSQYMIEVLDRFNRGKNDPQMMSSQERESMLEADLSRLYQLQSKLPPIPQNGASDTSLSIAITQHHIDVQLMLMVLHCQMLRSMRNQHTSAKRAKYRELLKCSRMVTEMFDSIHSLDPTETASSWPRCFGVFCAAVMLGIATIRQEVGVSIGSKRVERTLGIFKDLAKAGQASGVAELAKKSLDLVVERIRELEHPPTSATGLTIGPTVTCPTTPTGEVTPPAAPLTDLSAKVRRNVAGLKRRRRPSLEGKLGANKRQMFEFKDIAPCNLEQRRASWHPGTEHHYAQAMAAFHDPSASNAQNRPESQSFQDKCPPLAVSTSFAAPDQRAMSSVGFGSAPLEHFHEFQAAHHWVHPPMMYHPPMYDDWWQAQFTPYDTMTPDHSRQAFFESPLGLPMDQTRHLESTPRGGEHAGFAHLKQEAAVHHDPGMVMNTSMVRSLCSTQAV
ncbi:uncharacterized protein PV07_02473 [Cladophialophora immunda]|uniref:Zn(2)-C6 fungal-type domain-containing protein n=1 Tax=Cladophialophora immunda TaxID=569365 RepID=A0A0D1ZRT4_9EURO|nr:uncharacterized protein PV07_02473 [Cladophialophora immunda]KIW30771.1 hypothetical protein PV07_02473 [Cladophialophora immunda]